MRRLVMIVIVGMLCSSAQARTDPAIVAADGSGEFNSVQAAIDSIPKGNEPRVIVIKPGVYKERIVVPKDKRFITLKGGDADASKTVLTNDWNANYTPPSATRP